MSAGFVPPLPHPVVPLSRPLLLVTVCGRLYRWQRAMTSFSSSELTRFPSVPLPPLLSHAITMKHVSIFTSSFITNVCHSPNHCRICFSCGGKWRHEKPDRSTIETKAWGRSMCVRPCVNAPPHWLLQCIGSPLSVSAELCEWKALDYVHWGPMGQWIRSLLCYRKSTD